jgi:hypothetical protein
MRRIRLADAPVPIALIAGVVITPIRHLALAVVDTRILVVGFTNTAGARLARMLACCLVAVARWRASARRIVWTRLAVGSIAVAWIGAAVLMTTRVWIAAAAIPRCDSY